MMLKLLSKTALLIIAFVLGCTAFYFHIGAYLLRFLANAHRDAARDLDRRAAKLVKYVFGIKAPRKKRSTPSVKKNTPKPKKVKTLPPVEKDAQLPALPKPDNALDSLEGMTVKQLRGLCNQNEIVWKNARGKNKHMLKADMILQLRSRVYRDLNNGKPALRVVS